MIKKLTILSIITLSFFTGLFLGSDLSPRQDCLDWKKYFAEHYHKALIDLDTCSRLVNHIMTEFYDYEDGLWQLKRGLRAWKAWTEEWQQFWEIQETENKFEI